MNWFSLFCLGQSKLHKYPPEPKAVIAAFLVLVETDIQTICYLDKKRACRESKVHSWFKHVAIMKRWAFSVQKGAASMTADVNPSLQSSKASGFI